MPPTPMDERISNGPRRVPGDRVISRLRSIPCASMELVMISWSLSLEASRLLPMMLDLMLRNKLSQQPLEFRHATREIVDRLSFRIRQPPVLHFVFGANAHHTPRHAD